MGVYLVLFVVFVSGESVAVSGMHPDLVTCEAAKLVAAPLIADNMSKNPAVRGYHLDCAVTNAPKRAAL